VRLSNWQEDKDVVSGILPTGIRFGPDGALYAADWINGWGTKNYGRVWKVDVTDDKNDLKAERVENKTFDATGLYFTVRSRT
jgi:hypothetical protein